MALKTFTLPVTHRLPFWKVTYRRHTNFAMESIEQTFNGQADFGRRVTMHVSAAMVILHTEPIFRLLYLKFLLRMLPMLDGLIALVSSLSNRSRLRLVDSVSIASMVIGCTSGISSPITSEQARGYNKMIGNTTQLTYITDPEFDAVDGPCATDAAP